MALVEGTNVGFVATAPTSDPSGTSFLVAYTNYSAPRGLKQTAPAGATSVTELGLWINSAVSSRTITMGIYSHDTTNDKPLNLLGSVTVASGTTANVWKTASASITITGGVIYWVCFVLDYNASGDTYADNGAVGTIRRSYYNTGAYSTLPDPWGTSTEGTGTGYALYAVWGAATTPGIKINIGDTWKDVSGATCIQINVGDIWKTVTKGEINIGDVWKTFYGS